MYTINDMASVYYYFIIHLTPINIIRNNPAVDNTYRNMVDHYNKKKITFNDTKQKVKH